MSGLSELQLLIRAQEERLESLRSTLELFETVNTATEVRMAEFAALVAKRSKEEEMCTASKSSKRWNRITVKAQSARDLLQEVKESYQEIQRKYNGHLQQYKRQEAELQRLKRQEAELLKFKIEYEKVILSQALKSLSLFSETTNSSASAQEIKIATKDFLDSQFPLPPLKNPRR